MKMTYILGLIIIILLCVGFYYYKFKFILSQTSMGNISSATTTDSQVPANISATVEAAIKSKFNVEKLELITTGENVYKYPKYKDGKWYPFKTKYSAVDPESSAPETDENVTPRLIRGMWYLYFYDVNDMTPPTGYARIYFVKVDADTLAVRVEVLDKPRLDK